MRIAIRKPLPAIEPRSDAAVTRVRSTDRRNEAEPAFAPARSLRGRSRPWAVAPTRRKAAQSRRSAPLPATRSCRETDDAIDVVRDKLDEVAETLSSSEKEK